MIGAIIGDTIGSVFEWDNCKSKEFPLFSEFSTYTDDSVLTFATAYAILKGHSYKDAYQDFGNTYKGRGYGSGFSRWLGNPVPYNSWGNGSAMRVSPVGFAFNNLNTVLDEAKKSAEMSHNHPEGIKGAQATAAAIFLARTGHSKTDIKTYISETFKYDLNRTCDQIRPIYEFEESCQKTVPEAIIAFLESKDFIDAIRTAVSLGGNTDTLTCITGGIAQAFYKNIPKEITDEIILRLDDQFLISIWDEFNEKYIRG